MNPMITPIPVNKEYDNVHEQNGDGLFWNETGHFAHTLYKESDGLLTEILVAKKKFENYKREWVGGSIMGSNTFMYIYDNKGELIEKVHRKEDIHNESHRPELNDPKVLIVIEQVLRNKKIDEIL